MGTNGWETLDVAGMLGMEELPEEAGGTTTAANAGPYAVPLGPVLRRPDLVGGAEDDYLKDVPDAYLEILGISRHK
jgi:hypothetical protein